ncbi:MULTISPECIES: LXG domain-containing protein [unclassified Enterococcus]|uniref:LXG domain-containing protein n=1 Tax=Candidatus Enterococcus dunnyi TaxID=1834192 RepID=A0A200J6S4_9ENTE|nr:MULTISPECIES: LXG domain-containing protein [unclassified Enterococcus]OUZ32932.1 hypothetical protein A5889_001641 [Enterococcus sp. 9D6_DIV0238]
MGVDFFVGEVNSQSAAAKQMAAQYVQFSGVLKDSVSHFMSAPLSGKTYDSAKKYFSAVYPTLASGFILVCEALIEAHSKFPEEFQSQVDTCDVIEEQLKAVIAQGNLTLQSMAQRMDKEKEPNQGLEQRYMHVQAAIRESEEKLQKLYAFHASSPGLFADFEAQLANFDAGLTEVEKGAAWNAASGTFDLGRMNMSWAKPISRAWEKRQKKIEAKTKDIELENEKIGYQFDESGNLIGVFVNGEFDPKRTREIQGMIQLQDIQGLKGLGSGFLDQWANNNGKSILNELFGERQVNPHLSNTSGYANGQMLADLFSLAQGGAEFVGGFLWMFGGTAGSIATSPVTGGASAAAIPAINTSGLAISGHGAGVLTSAFGNLHNGKYQGNSNAITNMKEFFETEFGSSIKNKVSKTKKNYDGQQVYKADKKISENLRKNDQFYLDGQHKDHLEVFDKQGNFRFVLNLDGSINGAKTAKAAKQGRRIP